MSTSKSNAVPSYAIDCSTAVKPTCDSSEESFEETSNVMHQEPATAISNMVNNIPPSQDVNFVNSDKTHTPPSTTKRSEKKLE